MEIGWVGPYTRRGEVSFKILCFLAPPVFFFCFLWLSFEMPITRRSSKPLCHGESLWPLEKHIKPQIINSIIYIYNKHERQKPKNNLWRTPPKSPKHWRFIGRHVWDRWPWPWSSASTTTSGGWRWTARSSGEWLAGGEEARGGAREGSLAQQIRKVLLMLESFSLVFRFFPTKAFSEGIIKIIKSRVICFFFQVS